MEIKKVYQTKDGVIHNSIDEAKEHHYNTRSEKEYNKSPLEIGHFDNKIISFDKMRKFILKNRVLIQFILDNFSIDEKNEIQIYKKNSLNVVKKTG